ncbi:MAG: hypothetical protein ISS15_07490 [Alphaproteobacteria bacterium]|nr:hypothetical protein [Alphaproteobacteria bacterium]MBL7097483.1 hypothetical protein [Alphaproteobacteria bacterium]
MTTRSIALSLALCAMVLRALLPDGWMPAANAAGTPFVICSVDGTHHGGKAPGEQRTHAPCAFAAAAPLSPPSTSAIVARAAGDVAVIARITHIAPRFGAANHRPNAARAPPVPV